MPQVATRGRGRPQIVKIGRPGRPRKVYSHGEEVVAASVDEIPVSQAVQGPDSLAWMDAMASEVTSLLNHDTWELVELPMIRQLEASSF